MKKTNSGVTLIALIITIIVLLILAGITIAMIVGDNGILNQATRASDETEIANEKEKVELSAIGAKTKNNGGDIIRANLNQELASYIGEEGTDYSLSEEETAPFIIKYLDSGRSYLVDEKGNVSEYTDLSEYISVGDYIDYNPTVADKEGTAVEAGKLTYTSPTGTGMSHGNGSSNQTFTATSDTKWRVFNIENGTIELISEDAILTDEGTEFTMYGPVGYLYCEQELHEICKIYGYGYGADTSQVTEYNYGGPLDGDLTGTITGSGSRSIIVEDIMDKLGIYEDEDGYLRNSDGTLNNAYNREIRTKEMVCSTITTESGMYTDKKSVSFKPMNMAIENSNEFNLLNKDLLGKNYYVATRGAFENSGYAMFGVGVVSTYDQTSYGGMMYGKYRDNEYYTDTSGVRPIVTINSDLIDIESSEEYNGQKMWSLK